MLVFPVSGPFRVMAGNGIFNIFSFNELSRARHVRGARVYRIWGYGVLYSIKIRSIDHFYGNLPLTIVHLISLAARR
jgi:hypothetical protein